MNEARKKGRKMAAENKDDVGRKVGRKEGR
jgi:hypothetical protein